MKKYRIPEGCKMRAAFVSGTPPGCGFFLIMLSGGVARQASLWIWPLASGHPPYPALRAIAFGDAIFALSRSVNHRLKIWHPSGMTNKRGSEDV